MTIDSMIAATIANEGGYSNNPADPGGATMYGITEKVARDNGYTGAMQNLTRDQAIAIYRSQYAIKPGFAAIEQISPQVGAELFDTGVNMGPAVPSLWFQQILNALNNGAKLYPDIKEDGNLGPASIATFRAYRSARGVDADTVMLKALNGMQAARYIELARTRAANEAFLFGWLRGRVA